MGEGVLGSIPDLAGGISGFRKLYEKET